MLHRSHDCRAEFVDTRRRRKNGRESARHARTADGSAIRLNKDVAITLYVHHDAADCHRIALKIISPPAAEHILQPPTGPLLSLRYSAFLDAMRSP